MGATGEATESVVADENPAPDPTPDSRENAGDESTQSQDDADDDAGGKGRVSREAAKWRTKFRDAETTIAGQRETIAQLREMHVNAAITAAGVKPAAVYAVTPAGELLDDNGLPDPVKISTAIAKARDELGITKPNPLREHRVNGLQSGAGLSPPARDGWAAAFGPKPDR